MNSVDAARLALVDDSLAEKDMSSVARTKARLQGFAERGVDVEVELKVRRVRTPAGSRRYGQPIGTIITRDMIKRAKRRNGGGGGSGGEARRAPSRSGGSDSGGRSNSGNNRRRRGGRDGNGNGGNGGGGFPGGGGMPGLLGRLFSGDDAKKPRSRKPRRRRGRGGSGGSGSPGSGSGGGGNGRGSRGGQSGGGVSNGQYGNRSGGGGVLGDNIDRGRRDTVGRKSLPSVEATRESFWAAVEKGLDLGVEEKVGSLYFFEGRNTGVAASSASEARKLKKRGGDRVVAVRKPDSTERRAMQQGRWVRTRRDGKSPGQSQYGKGRGQGPPRS